MNITNCLEAEEQRYKTAVEQVKGHSTPEIDLILDQVWHGLQRLNPDSSAKMYKNIHNLLDSVLVVDENQEVELVLENTREMALYASQR